MCHLNGIIPFASACFLELKAVKKSFSRKEPDSFTAFIILKNLQIMLRE